MPESTHDKESLEYRLACLEVPEPLYRADLDLHDRSLKFSAEVARIGVVGIAAIGFMITKIPAPNSDLFLHTFLQKCFLLGSVVAFAASIALALLHRFFAGAAMFHHLQFIKLNLLAEEKAPSEETKMAIKNRSGLFDRCHKCLLLAAFLLITGALFVGTDLGLAIFSPHSTVQSNQSNPAPK